MVAVPYCKKCSRKIDPYKPSCPKCGSVVRFRFMDESREIPKQVEDPGFIRPHWKVEAD